MLTLKLTHLQKWRRTMPDYEYKCPKCGEKVLHTKSITSSDLKENCLHKECNYQELERVFSFSTPNLGTGGGMKMANAKKQRRYK